MHYYAQHQLDALDPRRTVLEEIEQADPDSTIGRLRNILGSFLFSGDTVDKRISVLSGGEKARVALAKMLVRPAALLCMDEPTNHLDLASKEVLEEALSTFTGTIVFISHDRYFINRIATQVVEVDGGTLTTYLGSYDDYLAAKAGAAAAPPPRPSPRSRRPPRPARELGSARRRLAVTGASARRSAARSRPSRRACARSRRRFTISKRVSRTWASRSPIPSSTAIATARARSPRRARRRRSASRGS